MTVVWWVVSRGLCPMVPFRAWWLVISEKSSDLCALLRSPPALGWGVGVDREGFACFAHASACDGSCTCCCRMVLSVLGCGEASRSQETSVPSACPPRCNGVELLEWAAWLLLLGLCLFCQRVSCFVLGLPMESSRVCVIDRRLSSFSPCCSFCELVCALVSCLYRSGGMATSRSSTLARL